MNNIETMEFSTANLERLAFYFKNLRWRLVENGTQRQSFR